MSINIKDPETDRLIRALAEELGETLTETIRIAVIERRERVRRSLRRRGARDAVQDIIDRGRQLPVRDERPADEILGYDQHGMPR